jgi:hypothetical protein
MRFQERELKPYASPVSASALKEGETYFSVQFVDDSMLIPIVETWVFAGTRLDPKDAAGHLYFQDPESYRDGVRYGSSDSENATFQVALDGSTNHIFEYEDALDELLRCSLRRRQQTI